MAVRTQTNKIIESVHHRDGRFQWERSHRSSVTDLNVFVIAAADATIRSCGPIPAAGMLPEPGEAQAGCSESSATEPIGRELSRGRLGLWGRQNWFRRGIGASHTEQRP